jgi:exosome complex RNA-binding protein Rrp4
MELIAVNAIKKIEQESHLSGLTDKIKAYLDEQVKK